MQKQKSQPLLGEELGKVKPSALEQVLRSAPRSARLNIRLTEEDLASMKLAAQHFGLNVTDYLLCLHHYVTAELMPPKIVKPRVSLR